MTSLVVAGRLSPANVGLRDAAERLGVRARLLPPDLAARRRHGDVVLGRVDVLPTLDGVEPGLDALQRIEQEGSLVLNRASALRCAHDKLATARALARSGVAQPATAHARPGASPPAIEPPVVVKPRFGSWGREVVRCETRRELRRTLDALERRPWFRRQGALVQSLVPTEGEDLRVLVACGTVVGAIARSAAPGEWRTNVALGARRRPALPSPRARALAIAAAAAVGGDLVGVDLLPVEDGYVVLEVNGCVDFTPEYGIDDDEDVFATALATLLFPGVRELAELAAHSHDEL